MTDCRMLYTTINDSSVMIGDNSPRTCNAFKQLRCVPKRLVIPKTIGGQYVTEIGAHSLQDCQNIEELVILAPIKVIAVSGIRYLPLLKQLVLPPTIELLDTSSIYHFPLLERVVFSFGSNLKTVKSFVLGYISPPNVTVEYCGNNIVTGTSSLSSNINVYVPSNGPSKFLGKDTILKEGICSFNELEHFFPPQCSKAANRSLITDHINLLRLILIDFVSI